MTTTTTIDEVGVMTLQTELFSRLQKDVLSDEKLDEKIADAIKEAEFSLDTDDDYAWPTGEKVEKSEMTDVIWPVIEEWAKTAEIA
jgi:hypothetical protein